MTGLSLHSGLLLKTLTILPHIYDHDDDDDDDEEEEDNDEEEEDNETEPHEIFTNNVILGQAHSLQYSK